MSSLALNNTNGYGVVDWCPVCNMASLSESHLVVDGVSLAWEHENVLFVGEQSLHDYIKENKEMTSKEILRNILGKDECKDTK